jgi:DNA-binding beta-propeller fold protein YncE
MHDNPHRSWRRTAQRVFRSRRLATSGAAAITALIFASSTHAQPQPGSNAPSATAPAATLRAENAAAPHYRYDPTWPKLPLPNGWTFEGITGMFVDSDDVVWVLNRPRDFDADPTENYAGIEKPSARCCKKPPAVLAFDVDGNLVHAWGDPTRVPGWPGSEHTILVDRSGHVWIGGATPGDTLLKFTKDGELVDDFGHRGPAVNPRDQKQDNQQTDLLLRGVAAAELDEDAGEIYIADGYLNRRVMVYDLRTGTFKRGWGAYGKPLAEISNDVPPPYDPSAPPRRDFQGSVHAVRISTDGLVYVSDRQGNRIQVFTKQGEYRSEFFVAPWTLDRGAAGSITFSRPPEQRHVFVTDIMNNVVWILDRKSGTTIGEIGFMGHSGGGFHWVHVAASDSRGNLYTGEVDTGKRVQRFVPVD